MGYVYLLNNSVNTSCRLVIDLLVMGLVIRPA